MNWVRNLKVRSKLIVILVVAQVFLLVVGWIGYQNMNKMANAAEISYNEELLPIVWLDQLRINNRAIDIDMLELMLSTDASYQAELKKDIDDRVTENNALFTQVKQTKLNDAEQKKIDVYNETVLSYRSARKKLVELASQNKIQEAYGLYAKEAGPLRNKMNLTAKDIVELKTKQANDFYKQSVNQKRVAALFILMTYVAASLLLLLIGAVITAMITRPVSRLQHSMEQMAGGDLTVTVDYRSRDEIGLLSNYFNQMVQNLRSLISQVQDTAISVSASSEQLASSAEQTSKASQELAAAIVQIASGSEEQVMTVEHGSQSLKMVNEKINGITASAKHVTEKAKESSDKAAAGNEWIHRAVDQMRTINANMSQLSGVVAGLGDRSNKVGAVVESITNIAAQTNLLALNAAIEAARAGEAGRGFAVVAGEVRKLSEQAAGSAKQIAEDISLIQHDVEYVIHAMQASNHEVTQGTELVIQAGSSFEEIQNSVEQVAQEIQEVTSSTIEMSSNTVLTDSIHHISAIAVANAAGTQQASAATQEQLATMEEIQGSSSQLAQMADELQELVQKFVI